MRLLATRVTRTAVLALLLCAPAAAAQSIDGFYVGVITAGGRDLDVGVSLALEGGALTGSYYYFGRSEEDLTLRGTLDAATGAIRLEESGAKGQITGLWTGTFSRGEIGGEWTARANSRRLPFRVKRSEAASLRFEGPPMTAETGSAGQITYRMVHVPASEHLVPLVTAFGDRSVISAMNRSLLGAADAARCGGQQDGFDFEADVSFVGEQVFSVRIVESWFCGAAYPTTGALRSIVFDLRTGRRINYEDLFRSTATPASIIPLLFAYEIAQASTAQPSAQPRDDDGCREEWTLKSLTDAGVTPYYHLTADGLVVEPDFPHVIAACANKVTVPYAALASVAAPGGPLARLAAASAGKPLRYRVHRPGTSDDADTFYTPPAK